MYINYFNALPCFIVLCTLCNLIFAFINGHSVNILMYISLCLFVMLFLLNIFPRSRLKKEYIYFKYLYCSAALLKISFIQKY